VLSVLERVKRLPPNVQREVAGRVGKYIDLAGTTSDDAALARFIEAAAGERAKIIEQRAKPTVDRPWAIAALAEAWCIARLGLLNGPLNRDSAMSCDRRDRGICIRGGSLAPQAEIKRMLNGGASLDEPCPAFVTGQVRRRTRTLDRPKEKGAPKRAPPTLLNRATARPPHPNRPRLAGETVGMEPPRFKLFWAVVHSPASVRRIQDRSIAQSGVEGQHDVKKKPRPVEALCLRNSIAAWATTPARLWSLRATWPRPAKSKDEPRRGNAEAHTHLNQEYITSPTHY
jgi:hypothetical protein